MKIISHPATDIDSSALTLEVQGRFDAHDADDFRAAADMALDQGVCNLAVDLSDVEFVDSAALAELVRAMKRCREANGELTLVSPSAPVRVILELTKLDAAFAIR